jgi:hypothetical protein
LPLGSHRWFVGSQIFYYSPYGTTYILWYKFVSSFFRLYMQLSVFSGYLMNCFHSTYVFYLIAGLNNIEKYSICFIILTVIIVQIYTKTMRKMKRRKYKIAWSSVTSSWIF